MPVHIPPVLVVIACKVVMATNPDPNAAFTHVENFDWATQNSMMTCQRHEVELYDPVEGMRLNPADDPARALNPNFADHGQCAESRYYAGDLVGSGSSGYALARVAHRLPYADRRSQHGRADRLQAARMRAPRHGGVRNGFGDLAT